MVDNVGRGSLVNSVLQGLQHTSQKTNQTNERVGTGLRIRDPLDGAQDFFTAQRLSSRATDLIEARDQVGQAISTIQSAEAGLDLDRSIVTPSARQQSLLKMRPIQQSRRGWRSV